VVLRVTDLPTQIEVLKKVGVSFRNQMEVGQYGAPPLISVLDPTKAAVNLKSHGVSFHEAATTFQDPLARIHDDPGHSTLEQREIIVGHSSQGQLLVVSFTGRGSNIRVISARPATRRERRDYEEAK
jgi:uncharacterized DUF497 family protein